MNSIYTKRLLAGIMAITLSMTFAPLTPAHAGVAPVCGPIDLAFIVDDTGSMGGAITSIKTELPNIIQDAKDVSGDDVRYALWTFKDDVHRDTGDTFVDETTVSTAILALFATGGDGEPEASDAAKRDAVDVLDWDDDRLKIAVLITDARPGGDGRGGLPIDVVDVADVDRMLDAAIDAGNKPGAGIFMSDIYVPTGPDFALPFDHPGVSPDTISGVLMADASLSGGVFMTVASDGSGTGEALSAIIKNCGGGEVVGGLILPTDSVALLLAGAFTNAIWIAPVLAGAAGTAAFYLKSRKN